MSLALLAGDNLKDICLLSCIFRGMNHADGVESLYAYQRGSALRIQCCRHSAKRACVVHLITV